MIANITTSDNVGALAAYLQHGTKGQNSDKKAEVLGSAGVRTDTLAHTIADFDRGRQLHPELGQAVLHVSLSFNPSDEAAISNAKMREIAQEYLQRMGLSDTQYLLVRHRDRPHEHLHIMANRVANDGHTVSDSHNFKQSRDVLVDLVRKHNLTPVAEQRPSLQHPERLRGNDLVRHELREAVHEAKATETERPRLLAKLTEQGITAREFVDKEGVARGISFRKDNCAFKGSALGPEFTLPAIERQLAANRQVQRATAVLEPAALPTEGKLSGATADRRPATGEYPGGPKETMKTSPQQPVPALRELPERAEQPAGATTPAPAPGPAPALAHPIPAAPDYGLEAETGIKANQPSPASPAGLPVGEADAATGSPDEHPAGVAAGAVVADLPVAAEQRSAALQAAREAEERALAAWEQEKEAQAQQAYWDAGYERHETLRDAVVQRLLLADEHAYQSVAEFLALLPAQQLELLPATAEQPVRLLDQQSGEVFSAEFVELHGRPFLEHVQVKAAEAAAAPPVVNWLPRYQAYEQERLTIRAHNEAVSDVNDLVQRNPDSRGLAAALSLVKAPETLISLGWDKTSLELCLNGDLKRQLQYEQEVQVAAQRRAQLEETAKGTLGLGINPAARAAKKDLESLYNPWHPRLETNVLNYQRRELPVLTLPQFIAQRQPGLDEVRRQVLGTLTAADFTNWERFKTVLSYAGVQVEITPDKRVEFHHKASEQSYLASEVLPNFRDRYFEAEARGLARQAAQVPQFSLGRQKENDGITR